MMRNGMVMGYKPRITEWRRAETLEAYRAVPEPVRAQVRELVQQYRARSDEHLLDDVYARYPAYAVMSERHGSRPERRLTAPAVYTLGYEGSSIDAFLRALIVHGLARIVDVRNNPFSRRYGYTRETLANLCRSIGVSYAHVPGLGVPSKERKDVSDDASFRLLLDKYERETLAQRSGDLDRTAVMIREKASALLCFEADATRCHRGPLAKHVATMTGLPVHHLEVARD